MTTASELDRLLKDTKPMLINRDFKGVVFSDLHMGLKTPADDFAKNEELFNLTFDTYLQAGFQPFFLGDVYELWENKRLSSIRLTYPSVDARINLCPKIKGNHDQELELPECIVLEYSEDGKKLMLVHGYQGDFWTQAAGPVSKFFVRHIWGSLQLIGFEDPTTATESSPSKHLAVRGDIMEWAESRKQTVIWGHSHFAESRPPYYYNSGSWVGFGGQCVEINGEQLKVKYFT